MKCRPSPSTCSPLRAVGSAGLAAAGQAFAARPRKEADRRLRRVTVLALVGLLGTGLGFAADLPGDHDPDPRLHGVVARAETPEGFLGDLSPGELVADPPGAPGDVAAVGTTTDPGFFSLEAYDGRLIAGTYGTPKSYAWRDGVWGELPSGSLHLAGESLFDMAPFSADGQLYGVTENTGKLYRFTPAGWQVVFQADPRPGWNNSYSVVDYRGVLITGFNNFPRNSKSLIVRSPNGRDWLAAEGPVGFHHPRFAVYRGELYAVGVRGGAAEAWSIASPWSDAWRLRWTGAGTFTGKPFVWRDALWVGVEQGPGRAARVYRWDGTELTAVFEPPAEDQAALLPEFHALGEALYVISAVGWRARAGTAKLYRTTDGVTWTRAWTFGEPEGWCLAVYESDLYAGTRREGGGGRLYRLRGNLG